MTHLSLHLLGAFQVTLDSQSVKGFDSDKVRALLAYLAVESDRPHRRQSLAGLLWPEQPEQTARSNLRYALANLRRVIGDRTADPPFLAISRQTLQFNPHPNVWFDVAAFTQSLLSVEGLSGPKIVERLEQAVALYRAPFLEGFFVKNSVPFEEWLLFKREQLAHQATSALRQLTDIYEERGDYETAQGYAQQLLHFEPWQEEMHQTLMRLLARSGQRGAALAQYRTCCRILAEELGVEPMPETTALAQQIRRGQLLVREKSTESSANSFASISQLPDPAVVSHPFVGREAELAKLDQGLQRALSGQGQVMFVTGEAGSGKTALLEAFARQAMTRHNQVVAVRGMSSAYSGLGDPYLPFREIVQTLTGDIEIKRAGGELSREHARRLWAIWPEAIQILVAAGPDLVDLFVPGDVLALRAEAFMQHTNWRAWQGRLETLSRRRPPPDTSTSPQATLFEQVTRVLQSLADKAPLILVIDDLQWADAGSLSLLFHLGRHLTHSRILMLGAYRPNQVRWDEDSDQAPFLPSIAHELQRTYGDIRLDLDQAGGRSFVNAYLDAIPNRLGDTFRETFSQQTGGNPLFTVELLRGLQESKNLVQDESGYWVESPGLDWHQLPSRVEAVIAERVNRLPEAWQTLLEIASVGGEVFIAEVIGRVQHNPGHHVVQKLSGALSKQHHLVQAQGVQWLGQGVEAVSGRQRLSRYRFRHAVFQNYLYHRLDEVTRQQWHAAVGNALEALYQAHGTGAEMAEIWPQLAHHFEAAGLVSQAVDYLLRAGRRAARMSAHEEAIALFSRGLTLLEDLPESPQRTSYELDLQLALGGQLLTVQGWGTAERIAACRQAYDLCLQIGSTTQLLHTLFLQADVCRAQGKLEESLHLGEQLLILTDTSQDPLQTALPHWTLGETCFFQGELGRGREHLEQAAGLYTPHNSQTLTALSGVDMNVACLSWLSWILWMQGYPDQALVKSEEALALAHKLDHPLSSSFALSFSGCGLWLFRREPEQTPQFLTELEQIVAADELAVMQPWSMVYRGWQQIGLEQLAEGLAQAQAGMAAWQAAGAISGTTVHALPLIEGYGRNGQAKKGLTLIDEIQTMIRDTGERLVEAEIYRLRGELLLEDDNERKDDAEAWFLRSIEVARHQQAKLWELRATVNLARLWKKRGRGKEARQILTSIYNWFTEGFDTPDLQEAKKLLVEELFTAESSSLK